MRKDAKQAPHCVVYDDNSGKIMSFRASLDDLDYMIPKKVRQLEMKRIIENEYIDEF